MAFVNHDAAIEPFNTDCQTTLKNGTKCEQQHCQHFVACEFGDDEKSFKQRYCQDCRYLLYVSLRRKTEEMKKKEKAKQTGKDYFVATGFADGDLWQYEHVNSGKVFWKRVSADTEEIIQACGDQWLNEEKKKMADEEKSVKNTHQTKLEQFFK
ncbi:Hypothetical predicted protein [Paramuricea clavata]|uniref:Uncharacterized protein n=1 Tax=Paramuricea clavata TaxID=317549 RepID=A0A7D9II75_PARCT|nr:Hypothetical predicted protein [Paramuricea clavata]